MCPACGAALNTFHPGSTQAILRCHQERVRFAMAGLGMVLAHKFDQIETMVRANS